MCTAVVSDGLAELLLRRAALVVWRERLYELVLCFWYGRCSSHFLLKFDCSLTAEFSARTIVQQDLVDWSETKIYDLVLFRYSIEFYDASISTADCMYVISCALSRVR